MQSTIIRKLKICGYSIVYFFRHFTVFTHHAITAAKRMYPNPEEDWLLPYHKDIPTNIEQHSHETADFFIPSHSTVEAIGDGYIVTFINTSDFDKEIDYEIRHRANFKTYEDPPPTYDEGE